MTVYTVSEPFPFGDHFVVDIALKGIYWDSRFFDTLEEALAFHADPLKADHLREVRFCNVREKQRTEKAARIKRGALGFRLP